MSGSSRFLLIVSTQHMQNKSTHLFFLRQLSFNLDSLYCTLLEMFGNLQNFNVTKVTENLHKTILEKIPSNT